MYAHVRTLATTSDPLCSAQCASFFAIPISECMSVCMTMSMSTYTYLSTCLRTPRCLVLPVHRRGDHSAEHWRQHDRRCNHRRRQSRRRRHCCRAGCHHVGADIETHRPIAEAASGAWFGRPWYPARTDIDQSFPPAGGPMAPTASPLHNGHRLKCPASQR